MDVLQLIKNTSRQQWIDMTLDDFTKNIVEPLNMIGNRGRQNIVQHLKYQDFILLTTKCWEEQDKQPEELEDPEEPEDPEKHDEAYYDTLPIVLLLEDLLSIRLTMENDSERFIDLSKQKGLVELYLKPHLFDDVANKINKKKNLSK